MIKKTSPLVTVLVASYNHQNFVTECIKSIVNQTYKNIELIVIDDGSTDGSKDIIEKLSLIHNFEFISQKNQGLTALLNNGLVRAKGKYLISISSDDACMLDRVEKQVNLLESREDIAVCAGNYLTIDERSVPLKLQKLSSPSELSFENLFHRKGSGINAPTAMCRTNVMRKVGGYNPAIRLEDLYMWLKIANTGAGIYVMGDVLSYYRKHGSNQSKNIFFMADNIEQIYSEYSDRQDCARVINSMLINLFAKSVRRGYSGALQLARRVNIRYYNLKMIVTVMLWLIKAPINSIRCKWLTS